MAKEIIYLTAEGYKKLKDELDHMRSVERPAISAAIAEARDKGDLSENAEYDAAREAQGLLEMRIAKLEDTIANARVIDESKIDKSKVQILSKVTLLNHNNNKQMVYTIVAEHEANLREGKLAIGTPIAKALLGHKKGDRVDVEVPAGTIHFEILDISIWCLRAGRTLLPRQENEAFRIPGTPRFFGYLSAQRALISCRTLFVLRTAAADSANFASSSFVSSIFTIFSMPLRPMMAGTPMQMSSCPYSPSR